MDEKTARKIGEVKAFSDLTLIFLEKTSKTLETGLSQNEVRNFKNYFTDLSNKLNSYVETSEFNEIILLKSNKTFKKVKSMEDLYIKDAWDDLHELCEWLGFFLGGAIVHWNLVSGRAQKLNIVELSEISQEAVKKYQVFFEKVVQLIKSI